MKVTLCPDVFIFSYSSCENAVAFYYRKLGEKILSPPIVIFIMFKYSLD